MSINASSISMSDVSMHDYLISCHFQSCTWAPACIYAVSSRIAYLVGKTFLLLWKLSCTASLAAAISCAGLPRQKLLRNAFGCQVNQQSPPSLPTTSLLMLHCYLPHACHGNILPPGRKMTKASIFRETRLTCSHLAHCDLKGHEYGFSCLVL